MNLFFNRFKDFGEKIAIISRNKSYSYNQLINQVERYYLFIKDRVPPYKVVAIVCDNTFFSISLFFSLVKNKNIIVPLLKEDKEINWKIKEAMVDSILFLQGSEIEIRQYKNKEYKHKLIRKIQTMNNSGLILFSSGSVGKPKALIHNLDLLLDAYYTWKEKHLKILVFMSIDHIGGLDMLFRSLSSGMTIVIPERREPSYICSLIEKYKINVLPTTPSFINLLLSSKVYKRYDMSSLKIITYGAEPMPEYTLRMLNKIFKKVDIQQKFGTSETGAFRIINYSRGSLFMKIDDPKIKYKIVNGELWLKSRVMAVGYLNASMKAFTKNGWFKTGDLVEVNKNGYLKITGRIKEIINVGGEKVIPCEVEEILLQIKGVRDAVVYPEKNFLLGEIVVADIVVGSSESNEKLLEKIKLFCSRKLPSYKIPVKINIVKKINYGTRFKKIRRKIDLQK
jgi:acyl-coenzyme A synthetase/AMP-(fatty) acid ligase